MLKPALLIAIATSPALASPADDLFDWATITHAGNAGFDRAQPGDFRDGRGSVAYEYRIAKTEVTSAQFVDFLNTFTTQSDALASRILPPVNWGGERDSGHGGTGQRYRVRTDIPNAGMLPILGVDWQASAMYVNWLNNDLSTDASAIENGAYDASTFSGNRPDGFTDQSARNDEARYFLPTYDEWFKAAHFDPDQDGQGNAGWWLYNDGSDTEPIGGPPGEGETSARWVDDMFGGRPAWETPLGSYEDTQTPWGLLDTSGGGGEWTETWQTNPNGNFARLWMGSPAGFDRNKDDGRFSADWPVTRGAFTSFRIGAVVPSPGTTVILIAGTTALVRRRR